MVTLKYVCKFENNGLDNQTIMEVFQIRTMLTNGVQQGVLLSALLFFVYLNDLWDQISNERF